MVAVGSVTTGGGGDGSGRAAQPLPGAAAPVAEHCWRPSRCCHAPRPGRAPAGAVQVHTCRMHLPSCWILRRSQKPTYWAHANSCPYIILSCRVATIAEWCEMNGWLRGFSARYAKKWMLCVQGGQGMGWCFGHGGWLRGIQASYAAAAAAVHSLCCCCERGEPLQVVTCIAPLKPPSKS